MALSHSRQPEIKRLDLASLVAAAGQHHNRNALIPCEAMYEAKRSEQEG
jgi:hypothetical protein